MRLLPTLYGVFWKSRGSRVQFHADVAASTPRDAANKFRALFPADVVCSVRHSEGKGRFLSFKRSPHA